MDCGDDDKGDDDRAWLYLFLPRSTERMERVLRRPGMLPGATAVLRATCGVARLSGLAKRPRSFEGERTESTLRELSSDLALGSSGR